MRHHKDRLDRLRLAFAEMDRQSALDADEIAGEYIDRFPGCSVRVVAYSGKDCRSDVPGYLITARRRSGDILAYKFVETCSSEFATALFG